MILGMTLSTFTLFHVVLSLVGIASGFIVVYGLLTGKRLDLWTAIFLIFTVLTSVTGFLFPSPTSCRPILSASFRCWSSRLRSSRVTLVTWMGLAPDLCHLRHDCPLPEYFRWRRAGLRKSTGFESAGSNPEGAAIPHCSAGGDGGIYPADHPRGQEISRLKMTKPTGPAAC